MSAERKVMIVLNVVLTRLDHTHVVVMLGILLLQMDALVKVTKSKYFMSCFTLLLYIRHQ